MAGIRNGTRVGGFEVEELIGKGGMANVYRAIQVRLQRPVALKVLSPALSADEQFVQRFQLEGVNAARLEHPNIVPVYEAGEDAGHVYLAMKLVDGTTLRAMLDYGAMPAERALPVLVDVGKALDYAHRLLFVHRDVKPANVLLTKEGHTYLSDFGLTKAMGSTSITSTGQWMGTPEYMPPEQARGDPVDHHADLYSFACMAYECLTGQPPFIGDNPVALILAHATYEVPDATILNPVLPPAVDTVFRRGLAKSPRERYESATEFLEALQAAVEERRLTASGSPADNMRRFTDAPPPPDQMVEVAQVSAAYSTGEATSTECPNCFGRLAYGYSFCGDCGTPVAWCAQCAGPIVRGDRFCQHCGATAPG